MQGGVTERIAALYHRDIACLNNASKAAVSFVFLCRLTNRLLRRVCEGKNPSGLSCLHTPLVFAPLSSLNSPVLVLRVRSECVRADISQRRANAARAFQRIFTFSSFLCASSSAFFFFGLPFTHFAFSLVQWCIANSTFSSATLLSASRYSPYSLCLSSLPVYTEEHSTKASRRFPFAAARLLSSLSSAFFFSFLLACYIPVFVFLPRTIIS